MLSHFWQKGRDTCAAGFRTLEAVHFLWGSLYLWYHLSIFSDERFWIAVLCQYESDGTEPEAETETEETAEEEPAEEQDPQATGETTK